MNACLCGCGGLTKWKYLRGHWNKKKGDRVVGGYVLRWAPEHPHAMYGRVPVHIMRACQALGKPLPDKVVVHHVDGDRGNNEPGNLVICQDQEYHMLLHVRRRALKSCGHVDYRHCTYCRVWDAPSDMRLHKSTGAYYHITCHSAYNRHTYHKRVTGNNR